MEILLGNFNARVGREDIFIPTIGNESLHKISNDNGVKAVNFAISKNLAIRNTMFPHNNIHKFTWTSPDKKTHNQTDHILIDRRQDSSISDVRRSGQQIVILTTIWWWQKLRTGWQRGNKQCTDFIWRGSISRN
jgi:hypothetical protein